MTSEHPWENPPAAQGSPRTLNGPEGPMTNHGVASPGEEPRPFPQAPWPAGRGEAHKRGRTPAYFPGPRLLIQLSFRIPGNLSPLCWGPVPVRCQRVLPPDVEKLSPQCELLLRSGAPPAATGTPHTTAGRVTLNHKPHGASPLPHAPQSPGTKCRLPSTPAGH